jgi:DNA-binding NarL/FixJ family response regulator
MRANVLFATQGSSMSEHRRVVVAVGPRIYREGLSEGIERRTSLGVSEAVSSVDDAVRCVEARGADMVLLDIGLPDAAQFVRYLAARHPAARVVALAIGDTEDEVCTWASLGVAGFLTMADSLDDLAQCIVAIQRGEFSCLPRHASMLMRRVALLSRDRGAAVARHDCLTPRQLEIVALIQARMSNKLIARHLDIELATVKNHVHQILHRLNLHSRVEVVSGPALRTATPAPDGAGLPGRFTQGTRDRASLSPVRVEAVQASSSRAS